MSKNLSPLVSIVVPTYNQEQYLPRCLDSLLSQTYENIEIILVNDGSTDGTCKICNDYSNKHDVIALFHTHNQGQSAARNLALDYAQGEYVMFVDSDDWIEKNTIQTILAESLKNSADIVFFNYNKNPLTIKGKDVLENVILGTLNCCYMCFMFTRASLWDSIRLPEGRLGEDSAVIYKLVCLSNNVFFLNKELYHYETDNPNSSTNSTSENYKLQIGLAIMQLERYTWMNMLPDISQKVRNHSLINCLRGIITCIIAFYPNRYLSKRDFCIMKHFVWGNCFLILKFPYVSKRIRIMALLCSICPKVSSIIARLILKYHA